MIAYRIAINYRLFGGLTWLAGFFSENKFLVEINVVWSNVALVSFLTSKLPRFLGGKENWTSGELKAT